MNYQIINCQIIIEIKAWNVNILTEHLQDPETTKHTSLRNTIPGTMDPDGKGSRQRGRRGEGTESSWTTRCHTTWPAQSEGVEGKGMESHRALLMEQEDPTRRKLFLCGFHRTGAGRADRVLQLPLPRAHALFLPSPGSWETKQRIQGITSSSLTHVLRVQGPDRKQSQKESKYTGLLRQIAEQIERLQSKMKKQKKKNN